MIHPDRYPDCDGFAPVLHDCMWCGSMTPRGHYSEEYPGGPRRWVPCCPECDDDPDPALTDEDIDCALEESAQ